MILTGEAIVKKSWTVAKLLPYAICKSAPFLENVKLFQVASSKSIVSALVASVIRAVGVIGLLVIASLRSTKWSLPSPPVTVALTPFATVIVSSPSPALTVAVVAPFRRLMLSLPSAVWTFASVPPFRVTLAAPFWTVIAFSVPPVTLTVCLVSSLTPCSYDVPVILIVALLVSPTFAVTVF